MARSRGSPARTSSPAASHKSSAPPPAPAAKPTTAANHSTAQPQQPHTPSNSTQPQVTNIFVQRGGMGGMGGGGSGMLGTMAAVAGGSVLGHGISNYLYGHSNQAPTQPAEAQELAKAAAQDNNACAPQLGGYSKCLEANPESADKCSWAWDYFLQCRDKQQIQ